MDNNRSIVDHDSWGRWGVILAGGDGQRLLPIIRELTGEDRPKQFCALSGRHTLLEQASTQADQMNSALVLQAGQDIITRVGLWHVGYIHSEGSKQEGRMLCKHNGPITLLHIAASS